MPPIPPASHPTTKVPTNPALDPAPPSSSPNTPGGKRSFKITPPVTKADIEQTRARLDALTYKRVHESIQKRYESFSATTEVGFQGAAGVTGDISDISTGDLISVLRHIAGDADRRADAARKSAVTPLFDKIYLMENGWSLRLHIFSPGGDAQGDEGAPHFHRWTLASRIVQGGYGNRNYKEIAASDATADERMHKYILTPSPTGVNARSLQPVGEAGMRLTQETLFKKGDLRNFPIEHPHSVADLSLHTGTTITLAHPAKAAKSASLAYLKQAGLTSSPLDKPATEAEFIASIHNKIALLQLITLCDALIRYLERKNPQELTPNERRHLVDAKAANYFETSFLPALAILDLARKNGEPSHEFSDGTQKFLKGKLARISDTPMEDLLKANQKHIEQNHFSAELSTWADVEGLLGRR